MRIGEVVQGAMIPVEDAVALRVVDGRDMEPDERELVAAARADPQAFAALYARFALRVYRYVRAHVPTDDEAADLTQQVFLRALDALPGYRERGAPAPAHGRVGGAARNAASGGGWQRPRGDRLAR